MCHKLAATAWITAHSYWMISEFLRFDTDEVAGGIANKHLALIPFLTGALILAYCYLHYKRRRPEETETM